MRMKVAMVSEHASPLAVMGGRDAGGQNVHVAALAEAMCAAGAEVRVYTRRDDPSLRDARPLRTGVTVEHVDAGPAQASEKDEPSSAHAGDSRAASRRWERVRRPTLCTRIFGCRGKRRLTAGLPHGNSGGANVSRARRGKAAPPGQQRYEPGHRAWTLKRASLANAGRIVADRDGGSFRTRAHGRAIKARSPSMPCGVDLRFFQPLGRLRRTAPGGANG